MTDDHVPSYYLTDEASAARMAKLIQRIAKEGLRPGECVPVHVLCAARLVTETQEEIRRAA